MVSHVLATPKVELLQGYQSTEMHQAIICYRTASEVEELQISLAAEML
jgi:hypothetical protein